MRELDVNKGGARKKVLEARIRGWFRAARGNVTHFVWASGAIHWYGARRALVF